jgi:hypothetical protein
MILSGYTKAERERRVKLKSSKSSQVVFVTKILWTSTTAQIEKVECRYRYCTKYADTGIQYAIACRAAAGRADTVSTVCTRVEKLLLSLVQ